MTGASDLPYVFLNCAIMGPKYPDEQVYSCDLAEEKCGSESLKHRVSKILTSSFASLGGNIEWQNI